jgi:Glycosyl transferases group 1
MSYTTSINAQSRKPRTLILSLRNIFRNDLFRCALYEFEDIINEIDHAEIIAPEGDPTSRRNQLARRLAFHAPITLKADLQKPNVNQHYDLFLAMCGGPRDLMMIDAVSYLKDACTTKVCVMEEIWARQIHKHRYFLNVLRGFDLIAIYCSQSVKALGDRIGRRCIFVPPGIDSIHFCPYPANQERVIDVYSIGRRSQATHQAILKMVDERGIFYVHDTIEGNEAINPIHRTEHRSLFVNIAKRSKYFIVNPGLIDRPDIRGSQIEMGSRYFEGAAAGMIMVGETPNNGEFEHLFDWPGAVVHLPFGSDRIGTLIDELEGQPEKQEKIRRMNVVQALARHDWAYRWEKILENVGLAPMPELLQRKERLANLAELVTPHGFAGISATQSPAILP